MNVADAIRSRKSIRGYKPDPVPKQVLKEILEISSRSPSALNTQAWEFTVVAGDVLDHIREANINHLLSGAIPPELHLQGIYRQRQVALAIQLFGLMGIARDDMEKRMSWLMRGFRFFDAPAAIIVSKEKDLPKLMTMDIGSVCQTICLAALNYGLGTCIQDQGVMFPEIIRKFTGIPDNKEIEICISIGYADPDFPANNVVTDREPIDNITTWLGFDK